MLSDSPSNAETLQVAAQFGTQLVNENKQLRQDVKLLEQQLSCRNSADTERLLKQIRKQEQFLRDSEIKNQTLKNCMKQLQAESTRRVEFEGAELEFRKTNATNYDEKDISSKTDKPCENSTVRKNNTPAPTPPPKPPKCKSSSESLLIANCDLLETDSILVHELKIVITEQRKVIRHLEEQRDQDSARLIDLQRELEDALMNANEEIRSLRPDSRDGEEKKANGEHQIQTTSSQTTKHVQTEEIASQVNSCMCGKYSYSTCGAHHTRGATKVRLARRTPALLDAQSRSISVKDFAPFLFFRALCEMLDTVKKSTTV